MTRNLILALVLIVIVSLCGFAQDKDIFTIIKRGSVKELSDYLKENPQALSELDSEGQGPLSVAVGIKNNKMAKLLYKRGADPLSPKGKYRITAMGSALWAKNEKIIKWFYENGLNINHLTSYQNEEGKTIQLHFIFSVVRIGSPDLLKFMIKRGADLHVQDRYGRNLVSSISSHFWSNVPDNSMENLYILLKAGADINSRNRVGKTLLMSVISVPAKKLDSRKITYLKKCVRLLISEGADLEIKGEDGWTALHCAVWFNHKDVVKMLLVAGANPKSETGDVFSPIKMAKKLDRKEILKMLKEAANKSL